MSFVLWNFVNLMDAEGGWFLKLVALLVLAGVFTKLLRGAFFRLHQQFVRSNRVWQSTFVAALDRPLICYIWFLVLLYSANLVTDRLISEYYFSEARLLLRVLAVLAVSWFLLRWKSNLLLVLTEKNRSQERAMSTGRMLAFGKLVGAFIIVITILLLMEVTGQNVNTLIAFGGISGLALAIASQDIVGNFFGGLMIYVTSPFGVGDTIQLPSSNIDGKVEDIGWYQTCLRAGDKKAIYIPNSLFSKAYVVNSSRMTHRKLDEKIFLDNEDLFKAQSIIKDLQTLLAKHAGVDTEEKIIVYIESVGIYSTDIVISALCDYTGDAEFYKLRDDFFVEVATVIKNHGAKLAKPLEIIRQ